jgi:putative DNA methylase
MSYRKKLIEVALPLARINEAAAREKSIRHGHPSTLHLWWARRPLAACRAVLFASLVDDPDSDPEFRLLGEEMVGKKRADLFSLIEELVQWENSNNPEVIQSARAEIARCVASRLIETRKLTWDSSVAEGVTAGDLVTLGNCRPINAGPDAKGARHRYRFDTRRLPRAEAVNAFLAEHAPPVLDPFCGGGSIPLEAQRLGLRAYASDLNPVAVLITKALIEIPPKFAGRPPVNPEWQQKPADEKAMKVWSGAQGLAEDVRYYGKWMRDEAEKRIGHLYPKVKVTEEMAKERADLKEYVGEKLTVIAWLWARTVASPNPAAHGAHVPLVRSFWLSKKIGLEAWVQPILARPGKGYRFEAGMSKPPAGFDPGKGTVLRTGARCLLTDSTMSLDHVRSEGKAGRLQARLLAIVAEGVRGRVYLSPLDEHADVAESARPKGYPDTNIPQQALGFRVQLYGMDKHYKLFTRRQLVALTTFSDLVQEARERVLADGCQACLLSHSHPLADAKYGSGGVAYADAVVTYIAFAVDKVAEGSTTLCTWSPLPTKLHVVGTFGRQALPMIWDFAEANIFAPSSGNFERMVSLVAEVLEKACIRGGLAGDVKQLDTTAAMPLKQGIAVSTDPPYYDNIGYADLSDFAYIWLRRSLGRTYPSLLATMLTPKSQELIASPYRHDGDSQKAYTFFERGLEKCFGNILQVQSNEVPLTIFYAFKQTESENGDDNSDNHDRHAPITSTGWETMLASVIRAGFSVHGTWPVRTEKSGGFRNLNQNALASSIVLVCRPRPASAPLATRKQFITALRQELPAALRNLQQGNIAPVDLAQAAIGPGMAVFTRYARVMETDGSPMGVRTALGLINQALDEVLAEQEGEFDGDTRWALAWFEQFGMEEGPFGVAETLSKAKNTAVGTLVEAGLVKARAGKVRLVKRDELPDEWEPVARRDKPGGSSGRLTVWETTQHLIRALDKEGEAGAAALLHQLGGLAETARDLAYRLYTVCERRKWAEEALAYNGLVIAWPELSKLALAERNRAGSTQGQLFGEGK